MQSGGSFASSGSIPQRISSASLTIEVVRMLHFFSLFKNCVGNKLNYNNVNHTLFYLSFFERLSI